MLNIFYSYCYLFVAMDVAIDKAIVVFVSDFLVTWDRYVIWD